MNANKEPSKKCVTREKEKLLNRIAISVTCPFTSPSCLVLHLGGGGELGHPSRLVLL